MSVFGRLFGLWGGGSTDHALPIDERRRIALERWGMDESLSGESGADDGGPAGDLDAVAASEYDRAQWRKKLQRILDKLPASQHEWPEFAPDADALGFDPEWIARCMIEEFTLMIRRAVADGVVTEFEHKKLDLARELLDIPAAEAEALFHVVVAEAESFFGKVVRDT